MAPWLTGRDDQAEHRRPQDPRELLEHRKEGEEPEDLCLGIMVVNRSARAWLLLDGAHQDGHDEEVARGLHRVAEYGDAEVTARAEDGFLAPIFRQRPKRKEKGTPTTWTSSSAPMRKPRSMPISVP